MKFEWIIFLQGFLPSGSSRLARRIAAPLLVILLASPGLRAQSSQPASSAADRAGLLSQFSQSLDELTARVSPSVVQIVVNGYRPVTDKDSDDSDDEGQLGYQKSLGSGVIVDPDGYIITNAHVVKGAQQVKVLLTPRDGNLADSSQDSVGGADMAPLTARIIGVAPKLDLALLKVDAHGLSALPLADYSKLRKGELVLAFGNPEGLENSVTIGVVSAVARQADPDVSSVFIQTDAPINPGNSGGALVNAQGELVGINTLILSESGGSQGLGFAIPSSVVAYVYRELRENGHVTRSMVGASIQNITPDLAAGLDLPRQRGVIVADVSPDGPAAKAGLKIQDVLLSISGQPVASVPMTQLTIATQPPGTVLKFVVARGSQTLALDIPVEEAPDEPDFTDVADPAKSLVAKLGFFGLEIDDAIANELGDLRIPSGVVVIAMSADQLGADTDLQTRDIVHALNGKPIKTVQQLNDALDSMPHGASGVLQVERDGKLQYMTFEMP
ncbi:MAG TPA: trypsin-like peptidase domain-containing protein [Candidatus Acidoferrum sp.]|nr:trypsin-like peptidase domain-containing protein [Candidatus Acidoferrum sp.]